MACYPRIHMFESLRNHMFWRAIIAEFIGTTLIVFVGCATICLNLDNNVEIGGSTPKIIRIAMAFGLTAMVLVKTFGPICGTHINPAVTLAFLVVGKITVIKAFFYIVAQMIGGILAAALLYSILPEHLRGTLGATDISKDLTVGQGFGVEFILSVVFILQKMTGFDERRPDYKPNLPVNPVTVGLTVAGVHFAGIPYTGANCNPARSFGPALISGYWNNHWVYWVAPISGAVLGNLVYHFLVTEAFDPIQPTNVITTLPAPSPRENPQKIREHNGTPPPHEPMNENA